MQEKLFSKKIKYLNQKLNLTQKKFASRHTTVHESWLGKGIAQVKGFYFDEYTIADWKVEDKSNGVYCL